MDLIYILVYVDDMLIGAKSMDAVDHTKAKLTGIFDGRDLYLWKGKPFLGIKVSRNRSSYCLQITQQRMAKQLADKYGLKEAKTKSVPMSSEHSGSHRRQRVEQGGLRVFRTGEQPAIHIRVY